MPETQDGFTGNDTFGTMLFKKTIVVGHTNFTKAEVDEVCGSSIHKYPKNLED